MTQLETQALVQDDVNETKRDELCSGYVKGFYLPPRHLTNQGFPPEGQSVNNNNNNNISMTG
jgi:hypothetical protein